MSLCERPDRPDPRINFAVMDKDGLVVCYPNARLETHISELGMNVMVLESDGVITMRGSASTEKIESLERWVKFHKMTAEGNLRRAEKAEAEVAELTERNEWQTGKIMRQADEIAGLTKQHEGDEASIMRQAKTIDAQRGQIERLTRERESLTRERDSAASYGHEQRARATALEDVLAVAREGQEQADRRIADLEAGLTLNREQYRVAEASRVALRENDMRRIAEIERLARKIKQLEHDYRICHADAVANAERAGRVDAALDFMDDDEQYALETPTVLRVELRNLYRILTGETPDE